MDSKLSDTNPKRIPPQRSYALSGKITLTAVVVLFTLTLLIVFIHLYIRWYVHRRRQSIRQRGLLRRQNHLVFSPTTVAAGTPRGLDPKVLNSLSTLVFWSREIDGVADCAVCLSEFEKGEEVRVLPRCDHRFHVECIDMWFHSHNSCPLCRTAVKPPPPPPRPPPSLGATSVSGNGEVRIEIRSGEELGLGSGSEGKNGILTIMRFLSRRELDPERGEVAERTPPLRPAE